jgi:hypothetical protein
MELVCVKKATPPRCEIVRVKQFAKPDKHYKMRVQSSSSNAIAEMARDDIPHTIQQYPKTYPKQASRAKFNAV